MNLAEIPLFAMLRGRLGHLSERQKVIAQNVANADTPRYVGHDLKPFSFQAKTQAQAPEVMAATQPGHIRPPASGSGPGAKHRQVRAPGSETTLNGNSVVLEEEMIKMGEARMQYDAAIGFYQKSLNMLRLAARKPSA
jgi:flagellar basal-body rod protein FlgB